MLLAILVRFAALIVRTCAASSFFIPAFLDLSCYFRVCSIIRLFISFGKDKSILLIDLLFDIFVFIFSHFLVLYLFCNFIVDSIFMLIIFSCFEYDLSFY